MHFDIRCFDSLESTNSYLYEMGKHQAEEGTVICATHQTKGKGRYGRSFISPEGNLYMSILIKPERIKDKIHLLTPMCAVCVVNAIYDVLKIKCYIKWVNDIFYNDKKVCGILTELSMNGSNVDFAVVGIGVNVFYYDFDNELSNIAGSVLDRKESDKYIKTEIIDKLRDSILNYFDYYYKNFYTAEFMNQYRADSLIIGKNVTYFTEAFSEKVDVIDIDDDGRIVVKKNNGEIKSFNCGEIRIKL